jgi:hypothetical protein
MKTSKVTRCPVCREQLSPFDRTHVREKHPNYFHYFREARKWLLASNFSFILEPMFLIINSLSQDWFVKWLAVTGALIAFAFGIGTLIKELSVAEKYRVSWWKSRSLYGILLRDSITKLAIRAAARATGRNEKEMEEKMKNAHMQ